MSLEIPAEHMEIDNKHGTWTLQPETLSGFLESEGLSTPQIESIPMIIGNSYGIDRLPMSPSPEGTIQGTIWVNVAAADAYYLSSVREHKYANSIRTIGQFTEKEVNLAIMEAAQFAAKVARGEDPNPVEPSRGETVLNIATLMVGGLAVTMLPSAARDIAMNAIVADRHVATKVTEKASIFSNAVATMVEDRRKFREEKDFDPPKFVTFKPSEYTSPQLYRIIPTRGDLAQYIGGEPNEVIEQNVKHQVLERNSFVTKMLKVLPRDLADQLGLTGSLDVALVSENLMMRILKTNSYDVGRFLANHPDEIVARKALVLIEQEIEDIIKTHYGDSQKAGRAATIGHAVNDLILRNSDSSGAKTKYRLTPEAIAEWAEKWRARF